MSGTLNSQTVYLHSFKPGTIFLGSNLQHAVVGHRSTSIVFRKRRKKPFNFAVLSCDLGGFSSNLASVRSPPTVSLQNSPYIPTWNKEQGFSKEPNPRNEILQYLQNLGIDTAELEELVLPSNLNIMKERFEFLQKLGLGIEDIKEYPLLLACSVKKNMVPVLDYLEKLGVRKSALPQLLRRYPQILHSSVVIELQPVVKYLLGLGITEVNLPRVLESYPEVLGFKLEGTMSTSVAYLISIGVNSRAIGGMITMYPPILAMRVGKVIKPIVELVLDLGIEKQVLAKIIEKKPYILGFGLDDKFRQNVSFLLDFGVRKSGLATVVAEFPDIFGYDLKPKLESQREFFGSYVHVGHRDFGIMLERMPQIAVISHGPVLKRIGLLRLWGLSIEDISKMVVLCPHLLALNWEDMELAFNFFRNEMQGSLQELVEFPSFFTYDLEGRIKPRYRKLAGRGLKFSLSWFLDCTDEKFEDRLDADYLEIEEMDPSQRTGALIELSEELISEEGHEYSGYYGEEPGDKLSKQAVYAGS